MFTVKVLRWWLIFALPLLSQPSAGMRSRHKQRKGRPGAVVPLPQTPEDQQQLRDLGQHVPPQWQRGRRWGGHGRGNGSIGMGSVGGVTLKAASGAKPRSASGQAAHRAADLLVPHNETTSILSDSGMGAQALAQMGGRAHSTMEVSARRLIAVVLDANTLVVVLAVVGVLLGFVAFAFSTRYHDTSARPLRFQEGTSSQPSEGKPPVPTQWASSRGGPVPNRNPTSRPLSPRSRTASAASGVSAVTVRTENWNSFGPDHVGPSISQTRDMLLDAHGL